MNFFAALLGFFCLCSVTFAMTWQEYKQKYEKNYAPKEEARRYVIFTRNVARINRHNEAYLQGKHTFTQGINQFTDMDQVEFVQMMNGYRSQPKSSDEGSTFLPPENLDMPESVDWRKKGYVTPVKDQGMCGSCWAFSTTGSVEGQHFAKSKKLVSLSEQNLVDCSTPEGNEGCNGGLMVDAFKYIKINHGIDTEDSYPYKARDMPCHFNRSDVGATISGFTKVESGSEAKLQAAVASVGPVSVAIDASHSSFHNYNGGVYYEPACSTTSLDHGVLVVGYGELDGKKMWIVKNSWGEQWGLNGYIYMSRDRDNNCGIASQASYPLV